MVMCVFMGSVGVGCGFGRVVVYWIFNFGDKIVF